MNMKPQTGCQVSITPRQIHNLLTSMPLRVQDSVCNGPASPLLTSYSSIKCSGPAPVTQRPGMGHAQRQTHQHLTAHHHQALTPHTVAHACGMTSKSPRQQLTMCHGCRTVHHKADCTQCSQSQRVGARMRHET